MNIYVASSWRNGMQSAVVHLLRCARFEVYDFKNPKEDNHGFSWKKIEPDWQNWTVEQYLKALQSPIAEAGFNLDYDAMKAADCCVLVLPCGRSAHLEAGYFVGANKPLHIYLPEPKTEPELMYKMATSITTDTMTLLKELGVKD